MTLFFQSDENSLYPLGQLASGTYVLRRYVIQTGHSWSFRIGLSNNGVNTTANAYVEVTRPEGGTTQVAGKAFTQKDIGAASTVIAMTSAIRWIEDMTYQMFGTSPFAAHSR